MKTRTVSRIKIVNAPPAQVFNAIDDLGVTGMHMTESSMMMMGSKLDLQFLTPHHSGLGSTYRWTGKMMGLKMDFTVKVTKWIDGKEKIWETIGKPKLIIYSWYRMHLEISPVDKATVAKLSISYTRPEGFFYRMVSFFFADFYCRWCLRNMLDDADKSVMAENLQTHLVY